MAVADHGLACHDDPEAEGAQPQESWFVWSRDRGRSDERSCFSLPSPNLDNNRNTLESRWTVFQRYCLATQPLDQIAFHSSMGFDTQTDPVRFCCLSSISAATVPDTVAGLSRTDSSFASLLWPVVPGPP